MDARQRYLFDTRGYIVIPECIAPTQLVELSEGNATPLIRTGICCRRLTTASPCERKWSEAKRP
jgi:hypothetical protein